MDNTILASKVIALLGEGLSQCYVARRLEITRSKVQRIWKRFQETDSLSRRPGSGRKRSTEYRDDRFLVNQALRNRRKSYNDLKNQLLEVRLVRVSKWTVRRRLLDAGIHSRRPARGPKLLREHRVARLRFARNLLLWTDEDWSRILFSDEARICLHGEDRRRRVLRRQGERYAEVCFEEVTPYGGGSLMFWAGITSEARTELVFLQNGTLNAQRYVTDILEPHVQPALVVMGDRSIFMDDNARPHRAAEVSVYMEEVGIRRFDWPARSPDLNPIEHLWDVLKRRVRAVTPAPQSLRELKIIIQSEWDLIPQETIRNLISSMRKRIEVVVTASGSRTHY